jgi:hypothetical protein
VKAVRAADVVISVVGYHDVGEQMKIIAAIKEAGNIKVNALMSICCPCFRWLCIYTLIKL